ncbi:hypothetical protein P7K49_028154 [Saguinus oedipus]|uniref:Uncharacterized protein n=1 Tax=Saguinus oedipus TaxID=9490 RepID=A0ABQ9UBY2_SAGOE|nr:hypothetical protein P7K49_028154 [Saguinus oedipus]
MKPSRCNQQHPDAPDTPPSDSAQPWMLFASEPCRFQLHCFPACLFFLARCWHVVWVAGDLHLSWVVIQLSPVHRPQAQESNYENLNQMNPRSPPAAVCSPGGVP